MATHTKIVELDTVFANCSEEEEISQRLPKPNGPMQHTNTSLRAMQLLIKDWRSNSLRTHYVSAKMVGWLYPSHSRVEQSCGTTTIYNTLDIRVSRRQ